MSHFNANDWYLGWGWILWLGFIFLMFSNFGNWGYTYRAHRNTTSNPANRQSTFSMRDMLAEKLLGKNTVN